MPRCVGRALFREAAGKCQQEEPDFQTWAVTMGSLPPKKRTTLVEMSMVSFRASNLAALACYPRLPQRAS